MSNVNAAGRVTNTIGAFKWAVIAIQLLAGVVLMLAVNGADSWPTWTAWLSLVAMLGAVASAAATWVLFGWAQHTLGMLVEIATAGRDARG